MTLFPFYELSVINKYQRNEEFISLDEQKIYSLERIKGYNVPEINILEIFEVINIELFIDTYIKIILGNNVKINYNDIETLSIVIFLFNQFLFPFNLSSENNLIKKNSEEYFYEYNPDNKENIYNLDISKKNLILKKEEEKVQKIEEYINNDSDLSENIKKLINDLKEIKEKNIRYGNIKNNNKKYNFYEMLNEKETGENNYLILNSFYKFNLYLGEHYCQYYLNIKEVDNKDTEEEKVFYDSFSKSPYSKIIKGEENNYNIQKIIFENVLNYRKHFNKIEQLNNLDIFDLLYKPKEADKFEPLTFLDFYKYYFTNLQSYFNDIISNNFVDCKKDKSEQQNCLYKYKKINLDKNILLKYNYLLEQMPLEDKNKCFPYFDDNTITNIKSVVKVKDISNNFDLFLINNKVLNPTDIIKASILNIVALSLSGHKLLFFTECIYDLIKDINISLNKFIEIILSIAYRVFSNEKNQNLFVFEKYFNIYNIVTENNLININSNIKAIQEKIKEFVETIKDKSKEVTENNDYKLVKDTEIKKLYNLEPKLKDKDVLNMIANPGFNGNIKNNKINFKTKILKDKPINLNDVFSPLKVFNTTNKILDEYYLNLDFSKVNKDEYKKLIIHLIYYCSLYPNDFNKEIVKFLIYCLKTDKIKE